MLGNQLGRKIGRRKMTVFGMRPRHTSIFITTITGSLIAILTLLISMMASQDVRDIVTGSQVRVAKLQKRETQLLSRVQELAEEVRRGTIIWNYEERIALNTIPAGANENEVKRVVGASLQVANALSLEKNNKIAFRQKDEPFELDTILVKYSPDDLRQWVEEHTNLERPVGMWVVVKENCLWRDPVPVVFQSFKVERVFQNKEVVYSTEIGASDLLLDWYIFLEDVKKAAIRKGMIEMNDRLGAEILADNLIEISRAVNKHGGKLKLIVVANRDLYRSSNLDVSIEVKPVKEKS